MKARPTLGEDMAGLDIKLSNIEQQQAAALAEMAAQQQAAFDPA